MILMRATGTGKTHIACALGTAACRNLYTVKYIRLSDLLNELMVAHGDGCYHDRIGEKAVPAKAHSEYEAGDR